MSITTLLLLGIGVTIALYVFREAIPRIAAIAVVVFAALWFYQSHGGDLAAMWDTVWAAGHTVAAWLTEFAASLNPQTEVIVVPAPSPSTAG